MKDFTIYERQRTILNSLYLKKNLTDAIYDSPSFTVEEESGTVIKYTKTRITFNSLHSSNPSSWLAPDVDTINLLYLESNEKYLFSNLKLRGYNSPLISLFSELELKTSLLKDPEYDDVLITREARIPKKDEEEPIRYVFHLEGGSLIFHRIKELDPLFWLTILRATQETSIVKISELHLSADYNQDLMKFVSDALKRGHYETHGLRPYAFYWLNNVKREGSIGKRSSNYDKIKNSNFRCESVYFGHVKRQPISIVFYDKEAEQLDRFNATSSSKTRIELRFNFSLSESLPHVLAENILASYHMKDGAVYRTKVFLTYIASQVRFTTHFHDQGLDDLAPWWKYQFVLPLSHVSLFPYENEGKENILSPLAIKPLTQIATKKRGRGRPKGSVDKTKRKPRIKKDNRPPIIDV